MVITGQQAESLFYNTFSKNANVIKASEQDDMFKHIDFYVDGIGYEVKSEKKLNRWDSNTSPIIWLEVKNVRGNKGWLLGEADKIAFLVSGEFWVIDRKKLLTFVKEFIGNTPIGNVKGYKKWYRREGRLDAVSYVYTNDVRHLVEDTIALVA